MHDDYDLVIAGGGPVGAFLSLALEGSPLSVLHVDRAHDAADRPIALSHGSRLLLERCGVFRHIGHTPIATIHVSQHSGFGRTLIRAADHSLPALGYVAGQNGIRHAIAGQVKSPPVRGRVASWSQSEPQSEKQAGLSVAVELPQDGPRSVRARLLVLADGGGPHSQGDADDAGIRVKDYVQSAVVAQVKTEIPHRNIAYERFTAEGPLALLPNKDGYALVWCAHRETARGLCAAGEKDFLARLGAAFGGRLGKFLACSERSSFPLVLRHLASEATPRVIAIGNAAQSLHPVAGQGLNLGLRDAWELATAIRDHAGAIDQTQFAARFARQRRADRRAEIGLTDTLVRVFSRPGTLLGMARGAALLAIDTLPPARRLLAHAMMYGLRAGR